MASRKNEKEQKYLDFVELFKKANLTLEKQKQYTRAQELQNLIKNDDSLYEKKVNELKVKATKAKGSLMSFWANVSSPPSKKKKINNPAPSTPNVTQSPQAPTTITQEADIIESGKYIFKMK